jgi:pentatricopeptide repeat protein
MYLQQKLNISTNNMYVNNNQPHEALKVFKDMGSWVVVPNMVTPFS